MTNSGPGWLSKKARHMSASVPSACKILPVFVCLAPRKRTLRKSIFQARPIKREFRNQLVNDTDEALLAVGRNSLQSIGQCCYEVKVSRDLNKSAKAATTKALEEYQKKAEATA